MASTVPRHQPPGAPWCRPDRTATILANRASCAGHCACGRVDAQRHTTARSTFAPVRRRPVGADAAVSVAPANPLMVTPAATNGKLQGVERPALSDDDADLAIPPHSIQ